MHAQTLQHQADNALLSTAPKHYARTFNFPEGIPEEHFGPPFRRLYISVKQRFLEGPIHQLQVRHTRKRVVASFSKPTSLRL